MFRSLFKAAVGVIVLPVKVVADVATLGGVLSDRDKTYTGQGLSDVFKNLDNATKPK